MYKKSILFCVCSLFFQACLPAGQVSVEFPEGYITTPYENHYKFDSFDFYAPNTYGVKDGVVTCPKRAPFIILKRFFETLYSSKQTDCKTYFDEWNPDIEGGINTLRKSPSLEFVADWKQDGHWVVIMSREGNRGKSMIPFVMKADEKQKIVTDATMLGDFIGLFGKFLVDRPNGVLNVVQYKSNKSEADTLSLETKKMSSTMIYLLISTILAFCALIVIYVYKFRN